MSDNTFANNLPGDARKIEHLLFEEWADPEDQHIAEVLERHVTKEGRTLEPGDLITPRQARAERVRWRNRGPHKPRDAGEFCVPPERRVGNAGSESRSA